LSQGATSPQNTTARRFHKHNTPYIGNSPEGRVREEDEETQNRTRGGVESVVCMVEVLEEV
jgi:hypothetical protein